MQAAHATFRLEIAQRSVSLTPIDPRESTEIFVRNGLLKGIREQPPF